MRWITTTGKNELRCRLRYAKAQQAMSLLKKLLSAFARKPKPVHTFLRITGKGVCSGDALPTNQKP
jgi:hypothetical protein